jgi:WD40 repeat protein
MSDVSSWIVHDAPDNAQHRMTVGSFACFSSDGSRVLIAPFSSPTTMWNVMTGSKIGSLDNGPAYATCAASSPDDSALAIGTMQGLVIFPIKSEVGTRDPIWVTNVSIPIISIKFSPSGKVLAVASLPGDVYLIETKDLNQPLRVIHEFHETRPRSLDFSASGDILVWCDIDEVKLLRLNNMALKSVHIPDLGILQAASISADGRSVAVGGERGAVLVDTTTGAENGKIIPLSRVISIAISRDGRQLIAGDDKGDATVWKLGTGRLLRRFSVIRSPLRVPIKASITALTIWIAICAACLRAGVLKRGGC